MRTLSLLIIMQFSVVLAFGQSDNKESFNYDVSFWKKELKLSRVQVAQIYQINHSMYDAIHELARNHNGSTQLDVVVRDWRTATMGVLSERQKMRWDKLQLSYSGSASENYR